MVDLYDGKLVMELEIMFLVIPKSSKHGIRIGIVCIQIFCSNSFFFVVESYDCCCHQRFAQYLLVLLQDGNEVFFRIKRSTQLKKLMNAYCDRQSVELNSIAFLFDGRRLRAEQTPDELEMEDGDEIDAMLHQTGGAAQL